MIFIDRKKIKEPKLLGKYRKKHSKWEDLSLEDKEILRSELKKLQNFSCAYCEKLLTKDHSLHIEHFKSRAEFPDQTFNWDNLFLCCLSPGNSYCASYKDDKKNPYRDLSILKPDVNNPDRYFFYRGGKIEIRDDCPDKQLAENTINRLNLNHIALQQERFTLIKTLNNLVKGMNDLPHNTSEWSEIIQTIKEYYGFSGLIDQYFYGNAVVKNIKK